MRALVRRAARAASFATVMGATAALLATPAAAAPTEPAPGCSAPIDGAVVCLVRSKDELGYSLVTATLTTTDGRLVAGGLVAVEACSSMCRSWNVATGQSVASISSPPTPVGRGTGYYRANASWVDSFGLVHTGVTAS